jgi:hypothetical protein
MDRNSKKPRKRRHMLDQDLPDDLKVQDTHTKPAAFLKSQGMFLSAQTVKNGSGAKLVTESSLG